MRTRQASGNQWCQDCTVANQTVRFQAPTQELRRGPQLGCCTLRSHSTVPEPHPRPVPETAVARVGGRQHEAGTATTGRRLDARAVLGTAPSSPRRHSMAPATRAVTDAVAGGQGALHRLPFHRMRRLLPLAPSAESIRPRGGRAVGAADESSISRWCLLHACTAVARLCCPDRGGCVPGHHGFHACDAAASSSGMCGHHLATARSHRGCDSGTAPAELLQQGAAGGRCGGRHAALAAGRASSVACGACSSAGILGWCRSGCCAAQSCMANGCGCVTRLPPPADAWRRLQAAQICLHEPWT